MLKVGQWRWFTAASRGLEAVVSCFPPAVRGTPAGRLWHVWVDIAVLLFHIFQPLLFVQACTQNDAFDEIRTVIDRDPELRALPTSDRKQMMVLQTFRISDHALHTTENRSARFKSAPM